jgi:[ribosomal protein S5]-alanine N-acetyltransferase
MDRTNVLIETERLAICQPTEADATPLATIWSDPRVTKYLGGPRNFDNVRTALIDGLADPPPIDLWPVIEKASGQLIGHCGLLPKEIDGVDSMTTCDEIELVYVIAADHWGRGYATEAALAIRDYGFHSLEIERLVSLIDPANTASERVALKVGMLLERDTVRPSGKTLRLYSIDSRPASTE